MFYLEVESLGRHSPDGFKEREHLICKIVSCFMQAIAHVHD
ncbi:MAG TPA: hypothetical protein VE956_00845 [Nodularia sp. (in: cyanobacteria)]|nr:hypothetical protein [Nodularia sp. (in: cyanobacteria)]